MGEPVGTATDLGKYYALVHVSVGRVAGRFEVMVTDSKLSKDAYVRAVDVTIYDDTAHQVGLCFYSNDLRGSVEGDTVRIYEFEVSDDKRDDFEDAREDVETAMLMAFRAARFDRVSW